MQRLRSLAASAERAPLIGAVSFQQNASWFLTVRPSLTFVSGFHRKAPACPFPLTQIEMTGTFPIDSSTCESRTLFLHDRRSTKHFWWQSHRSPSAHICPGVRRRLPEATAGYCCEGGGAIRRQLPDPILLPRDTGVLPGVGRLFLALPLCRRVDRGTSRWEAGGPIYRYPFATRPERSDRRGGAAAAHNLRQSREVGGIPGGNGIRSALPDGGAVDGVQRSDWRGDVSARFQRRVLQRGYCGQGHDPGGTTGQSAGGRPAERSFPRGAPPRRNPGGCGSRPARNAGCLSGDRGLS